MEIINKYFTGLSDKKRLQFGKLQKLYSEWNSKINVVSRKDIDHLYEKHVLHSLSISKITGFLETLMISVFPIFSRSPPAS